MERVDRDDLLMQMAQLMSLRGTCSRLQVGAIISRNGRIIVTGYNGAPASIPHCDHSFEIDGRPVDMPGPIGCQVAEHAERNAIAFAAKYGLKLHKAEMHCTHAPCLDCARSIINAGIRKVTYLIPYRLTAGVELLAQAKIAVVDMSELKVV